MSLLAELPSYEVLVLGFVVTTIASTVQSTVGMGFALVSVPLLSLIHPSLAPEPQILIIFPLLCTMVWKERQALELTSVGWIILGRFPGAALGLILLKVFSDWALDILLAAIVLVAVVLVAFADRVVRRTPVWEFGAGMLSSTMSLVSSIGGPPIALLYRDERGPVVRSNLAFVFAVGAALTVGTRAAGGELTFEHFQVALCLFPGVVIGFLASRRLAAVVDGKGLRPWILGLSSVACVGLISRAAWNALH